jgi:hypothetical protein
MGGTSLNLYLSRSIGTPEGRSLGRKIVMLSIENSVGEGFPFLVVSGSPDRTDRFPVNPWEIHSLILQQAA